MKRYIKAELDLYLDTKQEDIQDAIDEFRKYGIQVEYRGRNFGTPHLKPVSISNFPVDFDGEYIEFSGVKQTLRPFFVDYLQYGHGGDTTADKVKRQVDSWFEQARDLKQIAKDYPKIKSSVDDLNRFLESIHTQYPEVDLKAEIDTEPSFLRSDVSVIVKGAVFGRGVWESFSSEQVVSGHVENYMENYIRAEVQKTSKRSSRKISESNSGLVKILKLHGIDTTRCNYELRAERYERYSSGGYYTKKFSCPGDYLAYFSMVTHGSPTYSKIADYFGGLDGFEDMVEEYPTIEAIADHAADRWYGDGDDFIIYLKNLTTGEILYSGGEDEYYEDEDEDWDE